MNNENKVNITWFLRPVVKINSKMQYIKGDVYE